MLAVYCRSYLKGIAYALCLRGTSSASGGDEPNGSAMTAELDRLWNAFSDTQPPGRCGDCLGYVVNCLPADGLGVAERGAAYCSGEMRVGMRNHRNDAY
jgi:hypothetical protein